MPKNKTKISRSEEQCLTGRLHLNEAKEKLTAAMDEIANSRIVTTTGQRIKKAAHQGAAYAAEGYEKSGVKEVVKRTGGKFDEISGKAILEEMKKLIEVQSLYNDVLATKLQEALNRIETLEAQLKTHEHK
jgi:hypothetical protein